MSISYEKLLKIVKIEFSFPIAILLSFKILMQLISCVLLILKKLKKSSKFLFFLIKFNFWMFLSKEILS